MRAKKSLGQHFLKSERALRTIVEAGSIRENDTVLEIGPGMGALTDKLLETRAKILAIEKDDELFKILKQKYEKEISSGQLNLIHDDILNFEPKNYTLKTGGYKLIANIPYNLTGIIIKKFLEIDSQPEKIVLLVQKEVAERIAPHPRHSVSGVWGGKPFDSAQGKESILSISVKVYGVPKYIETVKAGSFAPMPKVDSAIISIENISKEFFTPTHSGEASFMEKEFFNMLHAGFKSKRKKLSSNLSTIFAKDKVKAVFKKLNLDENLRAEDVSLEIWQKLAQNLLV